MAPSAAFGSADAASAQGCGAPPGFGGGPDQHVAGLPLGSALRASQAPLLPFAALPFSGSQGLYAHQMPQAAGFGAYGQQPPGAVFGQVQSPVALSGAEAVERGPARVLSAQL
jgi:hypothetical protein